MTRNDIFSESRCAACNSGALLDGREHMEFPKVSTEISA